MSHCLNNVSSLSTLLKWADSWGKQFSTSHPYLPLNGANHLFVVVFTLVLIYWVIKRKYQINFNFLNKNAIKFKMKTNEMAYFSKRTTSRMITLNTPFSCHQIVYSKETTFFLKKNRASRRCHIRPIFSNKFHINLT